jgi:23S rRNA U2552 (ribose-2'-O)-methylase RlmE/FtsJ
MENLLYKTVKIVKTIEIMPKEMHKNLFNVISKRIKFFYECRCDPHLGYVKKNSIKILKKSEGVLRPNSFTGSFLFRIEFECQAIKPMPEDRLIVLINKKNDSGLYATAFDLPFNIFILKDYVDSEEDKKVIDSIAEKTILSVSVLRAELNPVQNRYNIIAIVHKIINSYSDDFPLVSISEINLSDCAIGIEPAKADDFCDTYASVKNCKLLRVAKQNIGVFKSKVKIGAQIKSGRLHNRGPFVDSGEFEGKRFWGLVKGLIHKYSPLEDFSYSFRRYLVSRAFFKMTEMIGAFPDLLQFKNMNILQLAESPGGFLQALLYARFVGQAVEYNDTYLCISIPENESEELWDRADGSGIIQKLQMSGAKKYFGNNVISINSAPIIGESTTQISLSAKGDLLKDETLALIAHEFISVKADLITADGAFGYNETEDDYQNQEVRHYALFIAEIIAALHAQAEGGSFVLKIFDILSDCTIKLLAILSYCYSSVCLFKPTTSRQANSEKYAICTNFCKPDNYTEIIAKLEHGLRLLKSTDVPSNLVFDFSLEPNFIQNVKGYNDRFIENEYLTIKEGLTRGDELLEINSISGINAYIDEANTAKMSDVLRFIKKHNLPEY